MKHNQTTPDHQNVAIAESDILLQEQTKDGILRLILHDVKRRNALSEEMLAALQEAMTQAAVNPAVRVVILAADGPAFCAGHDLKQMTAGRNSADHGAAYFTRVFSICARLMQSILDNPKPVIAEVSGVATAAGCQLVASCDLAIASESARFGTPGVNIGLFCSTPMVALSRNVSNKAAMEMLLTGELVSARKAEQIGLVNKVVDDEKLAESTMAMARLIASKSSMTVSTGKKAFYQQRTMTVAAAYEYTSSVMVDNLLREDAEEGINAFIEKRSPEWQDK